MPCRSSERAQAPELFRRDLAQASAFVAEKEPGPAARIPPGFTADAARPSGMLALSGARIVTMRGDEVVEDGTILIDGNRISAVGPAAAISYPAGTRTLDVAGKTIIPGLVDAHWHGSLGCEAGATTGVPHAD